MHALFGSDLASTLASFLALSQNHTRATADLHVHPNTLYRRLEQVTTLLGESWRLPPRTLEVQLALLMLGLLAEV